MRPPTRPRTPLAVRIAVAAIVLVPTGWWIADRQDRVGNEHRLEAIASQIAGRSVQVHCPGVLARIGPDTQGGEVMFDADGTPSDETTLREEPCAELDAVAEGRRTAEVQCVERSTSCGDPSQRLAWAIDAITHESFHLKGIADEATTECYAMQTMAWTATRLGLTEEQGRALARFEYDTTYPRMGDRYTTTDCADGGKLDLHPQDPRFP